MRKVFIPIKLRSQLPGLLLSVKNDSPFEGNLRGFSLPSLYEYSHPSTNQNGVDRGESSVDFYGVLVNC